MAVCIAKGILETLGIKYVPVVLESNMLYTVQCGAFYKKENAEALLEQLKLKGFDALITTKTKG